MTRTWEYVMTHVSFVAVRAWKTPLLLAILVGCVLAYFFIPALSHMTSVTFSEPSSPQEAKVNGVPIRILHQSPFTTHLPPRHVVPNPATNATTALRYDVASLGDVMTVVTAYFDLGTYWKGDERHGSNFTRVMYHKWLQVFARMDNPVIAYFEHQTDMDEFKRIRAKFSPDLTKIIMIDRTNLWSFGIEPHIRDVYSIAGYPKYQPGTTMPEYSSAMHAKYELMHRSVMENPFQTKYFAWTDVGLFRSISDQVDAPSFSLHVPGGFDESQVSYGVVYNRSKSATVRDIFRLDRTWVCGCIFVANARIMAMWTSDYMRSVDRYLEQNLMNTDQQVVYAMTNARASNVTIQEYQKPKEVEAWFHLGYACKSAGEKRKGGLLVART